MFSPFLRPCFLASILNILLYLLLMHNGIDPFQLTATQHTVDDTSIGPSTSRRTMSGTLNLKPRVSYESRLCTCGPCQCHLFSANAAHDLCLPDRDSSTALLPRRQTCKEWFQNANFQRPTYRVDWPVGDCESESSAHWRRLSGVQAKLFLVTNPCGVYGVFGVVHDVHYV